MKLSLRSRLILSFLSVIVLTAGLVVVLANRITAARFNYLVSHSGQMQAYSLAPAFADYYLQTGSWIGVEALLERGLDFRGNPMGRGRRGNGMPMMPMMGMMASDNDRLFLADASGRVIADSAGQSTQLRLSDSDLEKGAPIMVGAEQVGTLIVASGLGTLTADQSAFLSQVRGPDQRMWTCCPTASTSRSPTYSP